MRPQEGPESSTLTKAKEATAAVRSKNPGLGRAGAAAAAKKLARSRRKIPLRGRLRLDVHAHAPINGAIPCHADKARDRVDAGLLFPAQTKRWLGLEVPVPKKPHRVLETLYGKNWRKRVLPNGKLVPEAIPKGLQPPKKIRTATHSMGSSR